MKKQVLGAIAMISMVAVQPAAAQHANHMAGTSHAKDMTMSKMSTGTVKKVDKAAGRLTIAHGPLENLAMPAMTMPFAVSDKALLDKVKRGDSIRFIAEDINGTLTVTRLELAR